MRAPFTCDSTELCPEDTELLDTINSDRLSEIRSPQLPLERNRLKTAVFGICLDDLMGTTRHVVPQIPYILSRLCQYIERYGLHNPSLFAGDEKTLVETLKVDFIETGDAPLEKAGNVPSVARLLIVFFEDMPEPLISNSAQNDLIESMKMLSLNSSNCIPQLKSKLEKLPCTSYQILKYLSKFLLKVSTHHDDNGLTSHSLAVIFVPVLFRPSSSDPKILGKLKEIMTCIVDEYHAIFEEIDSSHSNVKSFVQKQCQGPSPSVVMPVLTLTPLSVYIPPVDTNSSEDVKKNSIPILIIEEKLDDKGRIGNVSELSPSKTTLVSSRKRKERRFSGEESQQRSSSEERPQSRQSFPLGQVESIRRCNSHEHLTEMEVTMASSKNETIADEADTYVSSTVELLHKDHSPHPPHAKRREVEPSIYDSFNKEKNDCEPELWRGPVLTDFSYRDLPPNYSNLAFSSKRDINQNSFAEKSPKQLNTQMDQDPVDSGEHESIPRSMSCPIPQMNDGDPESESSSLSLSWSMLFEDSEPIRDEQRINWSTETEDSSEELALLSPSVQKLRNSDFNEAPLSPSAYRTHLSYRNSHLDQSIPPSPPLQQEDFAKKLFEADSVSNSFKKLTKSIHGIKKKIKKFDEKFEIEFGYKPSHAEKFLNSESKALMADLYKSRKELKILKEEAHLDHVSSHNWKVQHLSHILGDTTNQFLRVNHKEKSKPFIKDLFGHTMKSLANERKAANRPENIEDMTTEEVREEKLAIQKVLLDFENTHGRPTTKEERTIIRPLYDRYRAVKKILVRSGSFTGSGNDMLGELTPILEHETMDFPIREYRSDRVLDADTSKDEMLHGCAKDETRPLELPYTRVEGKNSNTFSMKFEDCNAHEMSLSELIFQMQKVKSERRRLRKFIKDFETEFMRLEGRKPQKEDKIPFKSVYIEHRHVKGRQKLLEALITKHDQHQLM